MGNAPASEDEVLACLARHFPARHPALLLGRGDDCALFKNAGPLCVSSDIFLENTHFRRSYFLPEEIGHKALAVNLSDLAGCGARPLAFSLNLVLPAWVDLEFLDKFFRGMATLANEYNLPLLGGDISAGQEFCSCITIYGTCFDEEAFLARGGAMPGDVIFVVGEPGLARIGLEELELSGRAALSQWPESCHAHLTPRPQVAAGLVLARAGLHARLPALMDISDGITRDLPRLLGQGGEDGSRKARYGASLWIEKAALHPEAIRHAALHGRDAIGETLLGGEDYALLGACAPDMLPALKAAIPGLFPLGHVLAESGLFCNGEEISPGGFDHFGGRNNPEK